MQLCNGECEGTDNVESVLFQGALYWLISPFASMSYSSSPVFFLSAWVCAQMPTLVSVCVCERECVYRSETGDWKVGRGAGG